MWGDKLPEPRTFSWTVPAACTIEGAWGVNWSDQLSAVFPETCVLTPGSNHPASKVVFILFLKDEEGLCCLCGLHSIRAPGTWSLCSYLWGPSVPSTQLDFEHWQVSTDVASRPLVRGPTGLPVQCLLPNSFQASSYSNQANMVLLFFITRILRLPWELPKENALLLSDMQSFSLQMYGIGQTIGMGYHWATPIPFSSPNGNMC